MALLYIHRESVCMGDDVLAPNETIVNIDANWRLGDLSSFLIKTRYLACVEGGKATWVFKYKENLLAVFAQEWNEPKYLIDKNTKIFDIINSGDKPVLFFDYLAQIDPTQVYTKLSSATRSKKVIAGSLRNFLKK